MVLPPTQSHHEYSSFLIQVAVEVVVVLVTTATTTVTTAMVDSF